MDSKESVSPVLFQKCGRQVRHDGLRLISRCHVERIFEDFLLPHSNPEDEAAALVEMISTFDVHAQRAFSAMMKEKKL